MECSLVRPVTTCPLLVVSEHLRIVGLWLPGRETHDVDATDEFPRIVYATNEKVERIESVSQQEIDAYLATLTQTQRTTLSDLRQKILEIVPDAEEGMAYGIPSFRLRGKVIAGFAAFKEHLSYFPHSGSVLEALKDDVANYSLSKGTLRFPVDVPLPKTLVKKLLDTRMKQAFKNS